jgi:hypothetical protein
MGRVILFIYFQRRQDLYVKKVTDVSKELSAITYTVKQSPILLDRSMLKTKQKYDSSERRQLVIRRNGAPLQKTRIFVYIAARTSHFG